MAGGKRDRDGLTARERKFVQLRRADPLMSPQEIMRKAGYRGSSRGAAEKLMQTPKIHAALFVALPQEIEDLSDEELKARIRHRLTAILNSAKSTDADKIKAADKLLATIPGGFVPLQMDVKNKLTIESLVRSMGGAPEDELSEAGVGDDLQLKLVGGST